MDVRLMLGNEAIARGAYEAGVKVAAGYPGTPSTEILEYLSMYEGVYVEWSPNEKVALEVAIGGSFGGARSLATMKHVGLNVAADPLMTVAYTGVNGGVVIVSADDPGPYSSQNEQDNRFFARFALIPLLEPSDSQEAKDFMVEAFEISERLDTPVLLRSTTRLSHGKGTVRTGEPVPRPTRSFVKDPKKYVMIPAYARLRHPQVLKRLEEMARLSEETPLNRIEEGSPEVGIIASGVAYLYAREVMPEASFLKLGMPYPLPEDKVRSFARMVKRVIVVEELEPFLEEQIRVLGIPVEGKEFFPRVGELNPELVEQGLIRLGLVEGWEEAEPSPAELVPRPPIMCPGCPHPPVFFALKKLKATVIGDIGCYTLAATEPLSAMDTCICMGASIGNAIGLVKSGGLKGKAVATIGDSTFLHSGVAPLIDAVYNQVPITVIILDNSTTAMTGGQDHPGTGVKLDGHEGTRIDLAGLCRAIGVKDVWVVDPYDYKATLDTIKRAIVSKGPNVVITNRPCVLHPVRIAETPFTVTPAECNACQICVRTGCPSIEWTLEMHKKHHKVTIDELTCTGCSLCAQLCPTDAIILQEGGIEQ